MGKVGFVYNCAVGAAACAVGVSSAAYPSDAATVNRAPERISAFTASDKCAVKVFAALPLMGHIKGGMALF